LLQRSVSLQKRYMSVAFLDQTSVSARVIDVVKSTYGVPPSVSDESSLATLGFDSLLRKDLLVNLENEFCIQIPEKDIKAFTTIGDASKYIATNPKAR
jgi:acyl carrier protein